MNIEGLTPRSSDCNTSTSPYIHEYVEEQAAQCSHHQENLTEFMMGAIEVAWVPPIKIREISLKISKITQTNKKPSLLDRKILFYPI